MRSDRAAQIAFANCANENLSTILKEAGFKVPVPAGADSRTHREMNHSCCDLCSSLSLLHVSIIFPFLSQFKR